jgi:hypothetical protein
MLMLDVRNTIANILDRYTLADTVEVTLRKMRRNRVPLPFLGALHAPLPITQSRSRRASRKLMHGETRGEEKP